MREKRDLLLAHHHKVMLPSSMNRWVWEIISGTPSRARFRALALLFSGNNSYNKRTSRKLDVLHLILWPMNIYALNPFLNSFSREKVQLSVLQMRKKWRLTDTEVKYLGNITENQVTIMEKRHNGHNHGVCPFAISYCLPILQL